MAKHIEPLDLVRREHQLGIVAAKGPEGPGKPCVRVFFGDGPPITVLNEELKVVLRHPSARS